MMKRKERRIMDEDDKRWMMQKMDDTKDGI